jgi:tetratricopeptide (TPR) repeat protein
MGIRCDSCGRPAPEGVAFRRVRKGLGWRVVFYCPACFGRRERRGHWLLLLGPVVVAALGAAAVAVAAVTPAPVELLQGGPRQANAALAVAVARPAGWFALNCSLLLALLALLVVPHELGHALVGRLAGQRVFAVCIGHGPLLGSLRLLGTRWQLRAFADGGTTYTGAPSLRFSRLRLFLMLLGGPLLNGLLLAAALWWRPPAALVGQLTRWPAAPGLLLLPAFVVANGTHLLLALVPSRTRAAGGVHTSDGLQLLLTPFLSRAERETAHAGYFAQEGCECVSEGHYLDALQWFERGLERYPHSAANDFGVSCALLLTGCYDEAERRLAGLRARNDLGQGLQAAVADACAVAALRRVIDARCRRPNGAETPEGDTPARLAALLDEGERRSQEALHAGRQLPLPEQWSLMGTYGCLLVEQGRLDEGAAVLRLALTEVEPASEKAYCLGYLAVVAARQGRPGEARAALERARRLWADCPAVRRAEWELAQGA